jgi:hypothetical protein
VAATPDIGWTAALTSLFTDIGAIADLLEIVALISCGSIRIAAGAPALQRMFAIVINAQLISSLIATASR